MQARLDHVLDKLRWMREQQIWPNGLRYLWTDAFGVVLLTSLYAELRDDRFLIEAEEVVSEVDRVLGRTVGIRIGEQPDRDGQYFHYLAMWLFALGCLGQYKPAYRVKALNLARAIHPRFVVSGVGVIWKMQEDLSAPYPGFGLGALDAFHGLMAYRSLDPHGLHKEIGQMEDLVEKSYQRLHVTQDLGLGMLLWMSTCAPSERWAGVVRERSLAMLDRMWIDPPGYFCREPSLPSVRFAFTNYGVSIGLQAAQVYPERVDKLNRYFETYRSGDVYDRDAITHVMSCCSLFPGKLLAEYDSPA